MSPLAWAQERSLTGRIADAGSQQTLPGANLLLTRLPDSVTVATISDGQGRFRFSGLEAGRYRLRISFVGYTPLEQRVRLQEQDLDLGLLLLQEDAQQLKSVEIVRQQALAIQQGDTTQYAASSFKTNPDANAEDLIKKLPGVVVQGGQVQAQGEQVRRVLVDGREFFGDDAAATLRNLPAEIIDKIQVFDQQSEQSQQSGFDDGQTTKTINIVTKPEMRNGQFGRVYTGLGTDGRYSLGGNLNLFNDKRRISILAQSNNINQQNFSGEDLAGVAGSGGRGGRGGRG
ncbi:carboxypeptidase-like regulatory domain-containing protein, partial [Cesiribacter andamanensis]|uniref:carboxypeptidase-like regulatory domain-containing protein n=1 Tax=Cesiribacter andamanensis TaxID=649507 RepID=UPI000590232B